jgi:hypothetical protein
VRGSAYVAFMGTTRELPRAEWQGYFERFTKNHLDPGGDQAATVEVISPTLGDQFEASAVGLLGIDYDPKSKALEVLLVGVDHLIFEPRQIWVLEGDSGFLATLEVIRSDGTKEIIYVRRSGAATAGAFAP